MLIVAENASARFGGEAVLPLHYFRLLRQRGANARLVVNARTRPDLDQLLAGDTDRIHYVPDTAFHRLMERLGKPFPAAVKHFTFRLLSRLVSGVLARRMIRRLVVQHGIRVVHQPTPVSPKEASLIYGVGVPVVMGPMNGGITYPPGFRTFQRGWVRAFIGGGRILSGALNRLIPGKRRAAVLLVANSRTAAALPSGVRGRVIELVENGVDPQLWQPATSRVEGPVRFVFSGRLVDWKGVQYLIQALATVRRHIPATLDILGSGPMRAELERQVVSAGLSQSVTFRGWMAQPECAAVLARADVFVLPSLYECGGAVVLEAMACGLPVIATNWGGPADYLDASCGILVEPGTPATFPVGLAEAMLSLANDSARRERMGAAGRAKAVEQFDWSRKVDRIVEIYRQAVAGN